MLRPCTFAGAAALVGLLASSAQATPIVGTLLATGGDVVVTFNSNHADYTSDLYLDGAYGDELGVLFNNKTTAAGTSKNLGSFEAGTELVFKLIVHETGDAFYTGDESRNVDSLIHAMVYGGDAEVLVGFEDVLGGGDFDYNDLIFAFTNVARNDGAREIVVAAVDEPGALLLLGSGLSMLVALMRRQGSKF